MLVPVCQAVRYHCHENYRRSVSMTCGKGMTVDGVSCHVIAAIISESWYIHNAQLVPAELKTIECSEYRACKSVF
jgi:hypothetical protein